MKKLIFVVALLISATVYGQGQFQKESSGSVNFLSNRVIQLLDAVPEQKLSWSPQSGVRSFADVFSHIASANYFFGSKLGASMPQGVSMESLKNLKSKEDLKTALKQSYDFALSAINQTKDADLSKKVEFPFPGEFTGMSTILIILGHSNEHLGQLIAYARMNGITPPWSENQ